MRMLTVCMHMQGTTSCLSAVALTVTVVCVSSSHYVDGMIPIRSDRGSHCKQHVLETGSGITEIVFDGEGGGFAEENEQK